MSLREKGCLKAPLYAGSSTNAEMDTLEMRGVVAGFLLFKTNVPISAVRRAR
jgi:hypothetical protein